MTRRQVDDAPEPTFESLRAQAEPEIRAVLGARCADVCAHALDAAVSAVAAVRLYRASDAPHVDVDGAVRDAEIALARINLGAAACSSILSDARH